ncbi:hypothetical protein GF336_07450 [Candidatus Woesearchaeota archaeon]|nr:hypothetical protein [Candidatus Woesearchaeota archaeon]
MEDKLENIAEKEVKKGFFRRNLKKIGLAAGAVFLSGALTGGHFFFKRQGQVIRGNLDGKIDSEKYHSMFLNMDCIKDISQVEDLLAEVYHLNTGKKIEDLYRFNLFERYEFKRLIAAEICNAPIEGLSWGNGDLYVKKNDIMDFLKAAFHEMGHTVRDSYAGQIKHLFEGFYNNTEPIAERNVLDSAIALMYLDPDLGYCFYSDVLNKDMYQDYLFDCKGNQWQDAAEINRLRCAKRGDLKIKEEYASEEEVEQIIKQHTKGKDKAELVSEIYSGILDIFTRRFKNRKDFNEKYERLEDYFKYGTTDSVYSKKSIGKEKVQEKLKKKLEFYEKDHPDIIKDNLERSILEDLTFLDNPEEKYNFKKKLIKKDLEQGKIKGINKYHLSDCLDYAVKEKKDEDLRLFIDGMTEMNKKKRDKWMQKKINTYINYFK